MKRLALSFVGLVLALGAAELGIRVLDPAPSYRHRAQAAFACDRHHPVRGWAGLPELDEPFVRPNFATRVRTQAAGFRTRAFDEPLAPDDTHVVILGDSFGWGWGVERDERFDAVLMERAPGVVCTNLSQPGYGTGQELLTLREFGARLAPDVVLLVFSHNDLKNVVAARQYGKPKPRFVLDAGGRLELTAVPVPDDPAAWRERRRLALRVESELGPLERWLERSQLHNWIVARRAPAGSRKASEALERRAEADERVLAQGRALAIALLAAIGAESERLGARFVVAWNPRRPEVDGRLPAGAWPAELERGLAGIETIDLQPALATCAGRTYFRDDPHWTARAHRCVGEALARELALGD